MGINISDLQPLGSSLLSGNENILDSLRELSPEELRISGGGKKDDDGGDNTVITVAVNNVGGGCGCGSNC
ncbi:MAG: hypothetical protein ACRDBG_19985 [Waterburya sp.]